MMPRASLVLLLMATAGLAQAQCVPDWLPESGAHLDDEVKALQVWDPDGSGPSRPLLLTGGNFIHAGGLTANFIATWDGQEFSAMGSGVTRGGVDAIGLYQPPNGGWSGPRPVVGGFSGTVGQWDGTQWQPLGSGLGPEGSLLWLKTMTQFGPALYVGGIFRSAGGVAATDLARWDGSTWHALGDERAANPEMLTVIGGSLYAAGYFLDDPPQVTPIDGVLRYDNGTWVNVGHPPPDDTVFALTEYQGHLVAGGWFEYPDPNAPQRIAIFDGTHWNALGTGFSAPVHALCVFDPDGPGPLPEMLIAAGEFNSILPNTPANHIAMWNGTQWLPMGLGVNGQVDTLAVYNNHLIVGGQFTTAGGQPAPYFAVWGCPQQAACYANCDQSTTPPVLNVNDFVCFLTAFSSASPYANCDGSTAAPVLNVNDFICFMTKFASGCP